MRQQVREQGIDPDQYSFEGSELERKVTNTGTNDAIVREFMDHAIKDAVGTLPAKTIIFAVSHRHALKSTRASTDYIPISSARGSPRSSTARWSERRKPLTISRTRISPVSRSRVDMLDTGIDVPAIRNLVFAKPVFSKVKFWQMLGRGTRTWTDPVSGQKKADFLVIDHWDNFDYFQVNKDGRAGGVSEPLPTRLFRLRLEKLQILAGREDSSSVGHTIPPASRLGRHFAAGEHQRAPHAEEIRALSGSDEPWRNLTDERVVYFSHTIAPLLRFSVAGTYPELHFENQTEQLALAHLRADASEIEKLRERITEHLSYSPQTSPKFAHISMPSPPPRAMRSGTISRVPASCSCRRPSSTHAFQKPPPAWYICPTLSA